MSTTGEHELWRADGEGGGQPETGAAFDMFGALSVQIGRLNDHLDHERRRMERRKRLVPIDFDAYSTGVYPASGVLLLSLGQPVSGRIWEVRNWSCGSPFWDTPAPGTAHLSPSAGYGKTAGGTASTAPHALITEAQATNTSLNSAQQIGTRQVITIASETLFVVIAGGTPGNTYVAHAYVIDYPLDAELWAPGGGI